jgi:hypothetical protein
MGKNASPKVTIAPKNHMENHIFLLASTLLFVAVSINFKLSIQRLQGWGAKLYKLFHWHLKVK